MYAVNLDSDLGHLVNCDKVTGGRLHSDLWQVDHNLFDWTLKYIHPLYYESLRDAQFEQVYILVP